MDKKLKDIPKREKGRVRESWRHFGASAGYYRNTNEYIPQKPWLSRDQLTQDLQYVCWVKTDYILGRISKGKVYNGKGLEFNCELKGFGFTFHSGGN